MLNLHTGQLLIKNNSHGMKSARPLHEITIYTNVEFNVEIIQKCVPNYCLLTAQQRNLNFYSKWVLRNLFLFSVQRNISIFLSMVNAHML